MFAQLRPALVSTVLFTLLLGVAYPLAVTGLAKLAFPAQAEGSLIRNAKGEVVGSALLAQGFEKAQYLHPRPSAAGKGYDASGSSGSNYGPLNDDLISREKTDADAFRASTGQAVVPADAITTSASGLDPEISLQNAALQAPRIAKARGVTVAQVERAIAGRTVTPVLGFLGQARVNVLEVNLDLDRLYPASPPSP